jgi:hypothetical protein
VRSLSEVSVRRSSFALAKMWAGGLAATLVPLGPSDGLRARNQLSCKGSEDSNLLEYYSYRVVARFSPLFG